VEILVNTSLGELVDKLTILEIKQQKITAADKLLNVNNELTILQSIVDGLALDASVLEPFQSQLKTINEQLWKIEDDIRDKEAVSDFGEEFIELARSVYITNDKRAAVKKMLNREFGSELVEEKSYQQYS
jgi:hypothetical protein